MNKTLNVKLRRDVRSSWPRFVLMVIALAVSLIVFAGVLFAWSASGSQAEQAYLSTEPASATILLDQGVTADKLSRVAEETLDRPGVLDATARTQFDTEITVNGKARDLPLQVFVADPDDRLRMARFTTANRAWPPKPDEIFLSRDSLSLLDVAMGDTITVEAPNGQAVPLRVADTVYDPSLSPSIQEQRGRAYLSADALSDPGVPALLDQVKIQVADDGDSAPSRDRASIVAAADKVGQWLRDEHGLAIREIQVPTPYAHPHQWQADALLGSLLAGGAAALLLSAILVAAMLNNLFTQQIPQIGIMKAIGARSGHVRRFYLAMVVLVAAVATLVALGPAVLLGRFAVGQFLGLLGIAPTSLAAPWWTYLIVVLVGLGLPLLMALPPLLKASRTTVRSAIDHHGLGRRSGRTNGMLARLGRVRRLNRGLLMALRNTIRRPARFWLSVGLLAGAGAVFVAGMSLGTGVTAVEDEKRSRQYWDVDVRLTQPATLEEISDAVDAVSNIDGLEGWSVAPTAIAEQGRIPVTRTYPDQGHGRVTVTAVPDDTLSTPPELSEGRWLKPGETGAIVLNRPTRDTNVPTVGPGDTVELIIAGKTTTWKVVGLAEEREAGAYTTAEGLAAATGRGQKVNQLRLTTTGHDESTRAKAADAVDKALTDAGVDVSSADSITRGQTASAEHLGPVILVLLGVALPLGVLGLIGLATTMSANVLDRTREFGVLHAIGARPRTVRRVVIAEGVFLALTSCLLAIVPALLLTRVLGVGFGELFMSLPVPFRISGLAAALWVAVVILGAVLATDAAASRASKITVREALSHL